MKQLQEVIDFAYFDEDLFLLIIQNESRSIIKDCLIETYFNARIDKKDLVNDYFQHVEKLLLNEPAVTFHQRLFAKLLFDIKFLVHSKDWEERLQGFKLTSNASKMWLNTA